MPPKGQATVELTLRTLRLGRIQLPVAVCCAGSRAKPLAVVLNARSLGPRVDFAAASGTKGEAAVSLVNEASSGGSGVGGGGSESSAVVPGAAPADAAVPGAPPLEAGASVQSLGAPVSEAGAPRRSRASPAPSAAARGRGCRDKGAPADAPPPPAWQPGAAISFGKVPVLATVARELRVRNPTVIPAQVKAFVESAGSVFEVRPPAAGAALQPLPARRAFAAARLYAQRRQPPARSDQGSCLTPLPTRPRWSRASLSCRPGARGPCA